MQEEFLLGTLPNFKNSSDNTPRLRPPAGGRIHPSQEGIFSISCWIHLFGKSHNEILQSLRSFRMTISIKKGIILSAPEAQEESRCS